MLEGQVFFFFRQAANCKLMNKGVTCTLFGQDYSWKTGWKTCLMSYALYSRFSQSSLLAAALIFLFDFFCVSAHI